MPDAGLETQDFAYRLPPERIAQHPIRPRDQSRLLRLEAATGEISDHVFYELDRLLKPGDLLVVNDTRVFKARLLGHREATGGKIELLLLHPAASPESEDSGLEHSDWMAWTRSGGTLRPGERLVLAGGRLIATLLERRGSYGDLIRLQAVDAPESVGLGLEGRHGEPALRVASGFWTFLQAHGQMPLPPYIARPTRPEDEEDYQTVFAREPGAVAAPTAGLHFTPALLSRLEAAGIERTAITLHVGPGTFRPVKTDRIEDHEMLPERYTIAPEPAERIAKARAEGRRVVAVGTTVTRTLEGRAREGDGRILPGDGWTNLFIRPPFRFQVVGALITNFHLPKSTLLMLVSALATRERIFAAYAHALDAGYRFFSYGDAMLIE